MAKGDQINLRPHFKDEGARLPCEGEAGDLYVFTPLGVDDRDSSPQGLASLWFCIKGMNAETKETWARVQFDGITNCGVPAPTPPQNHPQLKDG